MWDSSYYWYVTELDAAVIQTEEFLMRGMITTDLHEVAEDMVQFLQTGDTVLPKNAFFVNGSETIH